MDKNLMAFCGDYCGDCEWKEKVNCKGCKENCGDMFWGECQIAKCCKKNDFNHCGECLKMPCDKLNALFNDPEHGDNGKRLNNLKNW